MTIHSDLDWIKKISAVATELTGNQFSDRHHEMIRSRLQSRIAELGLNGFSDYYQYLINNRESEQKALISLLTTHHTYFFREFSQFEFLRDKILPVFLKTKNSGSKKLRIWSAACSRGHEVYSLAIFLERHLSALAPGWDYEILGTDIDEESVQYASNGVYPYEELKKAPLPYVSNFWVRGSGDISDFVKIKKSIRSKVRFQTLNLLKIPESFEFGFDFIFCRNVFIYFNTQQIEAISKNLINRLNTDGYLFVGLSESLHGLSLPVQIQGPSIYSHNRSKQSISAVLRSSSVGQSVLKVLCVDDSPVILKLLKQIFSEDSSFQVIGTATNGLEAQEAIRQFKPDVMTLDLHMPKMDGLSFLKTVYDRKNGPPVVIVSSVSREDRSLAFEALSYGASDYVEKPSLQNLKQVADELKIKLKSAFQNRENKSLTLDLDRSFTKTQESQRIRFQSVSVFIDSRSHLDSCISFLKEIHSKVEILDFHFFHSSGLSMDPIQNLISKCKFTEIDFENSNSLKEFHSKYKVDINRIFVGFLSLDHFKKVLSADQRHWIISDQISYSDLPPETQKMNLELIPYTSFAYHLIRMIQKINHSTGANRIAA